MFFWKSAKRARTPVSRSVAPLRAVAASRAEFSPLPQPDSCARHHQIDAGAQHVAVDHVDLLGAIGQRIHFADGFKVVLQEKCRQAANGRDQHGEERHHPQQHRADACVAQAAALDLGARPAFFLPTLPGFAPDSRLASIFLPILQEQLRPKRPARDGQAVGPERRAPRPGRGVIRGMSGLGGPALAHGLGRRRGHRYRDRLHLGRWRGRSRLRIVFRRRRRSQQLLTLPRFQQNIGAVHEAQQAAIRAELQQRFLRL